MGRGRNDKRSVERRNNRDKKKTSVPANDKPVQVPLELTTEAQACAWTPCENNAAAIDREEFVPLHKCARCKVQFFCGEACARKTWVGGEGVFPHNVECKEWNQQDRRRIIAIRRHFHLLRRQHELLRNLHEDVTRHCVKSDALNEGKSEYEANVLSKEYNLSDGVPPKGRCVAWIELGSDDPNYGSNDGLEPGRKDLEVGRLNFKFLDKTDAKEWDEPDKVVVKKQAETYDPMTEVVVWASYSIRGQNTVAMSTVLRPKMIDMLDNPKQD